MNALSGAGRQELTWSRWDETVVNNFAQLAARNVCRVKAARAQTFSWQSGSTRIYSVGGFTLVHAGACGPSHSGYAEVRDREEIASDPGDRFVLVMQIESSRMIRQFGRTQYIEPGQAAFFCASEPYEGESLITGDRSEIIAFYMPGRYVHERLIEPKRFCVREDPVVLDAMTLDLLKSFAANAWAFDRSLFYRTARIVADLILAGRDGGSHDPGVRADARVTALGRVKAIIGRRLGETEMTLADLAEEAGFSLNYLHKLFRGEDMTLAAFVKAERLRAARTMLEQAGPVGMTVTEVALNCGFSDSSFFSRSFRQAYGITPRAAMQRSTPQWLSP
ncbi:MAG TPA: AraC family transcriptional regulator [Sphingobium sp.]|uniref:helix-turn-helix transcriptional regulator n=1 Tax=Sphingobium sp. TaxID=1912891 RepID=UPI002ED6BAB2